MYSMCLCSPIACGCGEPLCVGLQNQVCGSVVPRLVYESLETTLYIYLWNQSMCNCLGPPCVWGHMEPCAICEHVVSHCVESCGTIVSVCVGG